jgi:hypothetical protein
MTGKSSATPEQIVVFVAEIETGMYDEHRIEEVGGLFVSAEEARAYLDQRRLDPYDYPETQRVLELTIIVPTPGHPREPIRRLIAEWLRERPETPSRRAALTDARRTYRALLARARRLPNSDRDYLTRLHQAWDAQLVALAKGPEPNWTISDETWFQLAALEHDVFAPDLDPDVLLRLVDAYPDAVVGLFTPSPIAV